MTERILHSVRQNKRRPRNWIPLLLHYYFYYTHPLSHHNITPFSTKQKLSFC